MKKIICAVLALALAASFLTACGDQSQPSQSEESGAGSSSESGASTSDETALVVYSALPREFLQAAADGFLAKTGTEVKLVCDSTDRLIGAITAGTGPKADVLFGAGAELIESQRELFEPYLTAEQAELDERFTSADGLWTGLTPMPIVMMYNKTKTTQPPAGWATLAGDAYNGAVAFADPTYSGVSYTALAAMAQTGETPNYDLVEQFATGLDGKMLESISDVYAGVAEGEFSAGITLEDSVQKYLNAGYEEVVGIAYPSEGTPVAVEASAIVQGAPHLTEAQAFVDYVSSAEFQGVMVEKFGMRTVRTDTIDPRFFTKKEEITFADYSVAEAVSQREEILKRFAAGEAKAHAAPDAASSSQAA